MFVLGFSAPPPRDIEEGIEVNFGLEETGVGLIEPSGTKSQEESVPAAKSASTPGYVEESILTQEHEEAPEVIKTDPAVEKKRLGQIEAEKARRAEIEMERTRREQEEIERKKIEAEQKRLADIIDKTRNALEGAINSGTNTNSEGVKEGEGNQGSPTGSTGSRNHSDGSGYGNKGVSYVLDGREFRKLPRPEYNYQAEGKVVVEVSVDRSGKVVQAIAGIKGSNTLDEYLLRVAREAALEAQFDASPDAPAIQKGSITYIFILK
jgi:outer membrane biosynthesis protein TonB